MKSIGELSSWEFWSLTLTAALALILALVNAHLEDDTRKKRLEASQRQQFLAQTSQLSRLNSELLRVLNQLAERDSEIRELLSTHTPLRTDDAAILPKPQN